MRKILTIFGTRPEIIRLSRVLERLDSACELTTVHTGQNFQEGLSGIFLKDLGIRDPDFHLGIRASSFGEQAGQILEKTQKVLEKVRPDRLLVLGDTNSALSAIVAARMGIPVFHMEAGNRCYDDRVPEEINRRIIDHSSSVLLPYTYRSKENLVREGIERERIFVTGNPIYEVINHYADRTESSKALWETGVEPGGYFLVTMHRAENVDLEDRLRGIVKGLDRVADEFDKPLVVSVHPRTADKLSKFGIEPGSERVKLLEPLGFFDFLMLEKNASAVLTDSGTVQEECAIFGVPNVTLRDVTERPETIECGSNILSGGDADAILSAVRLAVGRKGTWKAPGEYFTENVSSTVANILLGHTSIRKHL
ncbi:MAG: UDP-N-acetylglucosamine 2-epimerase (non-hydrolyzing) [Acidobacteria bacterium]|nr:MAG: UDP-N-acetylglucosamine 2-epimerase (non-hydrolyzing) [Acidobacteriota bacterium]REK01443.1 MAG: UDP-N-acetylglucosamine 2-epimerase (non-hydrolyzing) [Acidobacteriota bacterium]REK14399.1 MAG: UDP-N-acetylglucosamine 2-epimerase (non-hydrolyzing) [Acidobacteriota bacterium]REK45114.1 MAG: UDP-N-acetylglucosamine 2-epimerase (non-hydrolyzing) [Acidobacteriota bacterium]